MMLSAGWVVLDEVRLYSRKDIAGILSSAATVCVGIFVLTIKTSIVAQLKKNQEAEPLV